MARSLPPWLEPTLPFLRWRGRVNRQVVREDLIAGITGAVVMVPQGVAFAIIAGMPPQYGLYAGIVPAIVAALFGSSWHLVSGPTTAASVVLFSALSAYAEPGSAAYVQLAITLTFMVGILQFSMGMLRLGAVVNFVSHSVIVGFTAGAAILIAASQLKHFLGLHLVRSGHAYEILYEASKHLAEINPYVTVVGVVTLISGLAIRRFTPRMPYLLGAMVVGTLVSVFLNLLLGAERTVITTVGALPATLPPLSSPALSFAALKQLAPAAVAMTLFALTEAVTIARSLALRSGQYIDGNQEFVGQGLSNIIGPFFSSYVATGSFNRSALNYEAGANTPLAAVFAAFFLMLIVVLLAPLTAFLPNAAMAGILFLVAWRLIDVPYIKKITRASRGETFVLTTTFIATLLLDLEFAILLGVIVSLFLFLMETARPRIYSRVPDPRLPGRNFNTDPTLPECPQLKIVRIDGSLYFGAVDHVQKMLRIFERKEPRQTHLLIMAGGINRVDISGAEFLAQEAKYRQARGGAIYLYRLKEGVRQFLLRGSYLSQIGEDNLFRSKTEALAEIFDRLDRSVCERCTRRIFHECQSVPGPSKQAEASERPTQ